MSAYECAHIDELARSLTFAQGFRNRSGVSEWKDSVMSAEVRDAVVRLHHAGFSVESISVTVSLPVADIRRVVR